MIITKSKMMLIAVVLPIFFIILYFLSAPSSLSISPSNLSIAFNVSDPNREQIESLSIKNFGQSLDDIKFFVEGSPKSITYGDTYNNQLNLLEVNINSIKNNISTIILITNRNIILDESIDQSTRDKINSTRDKIKAETDRLYFMRSNTTLFDNIEYLKFINSTLANINSNISNLSKSVSNWTLQTNSSLNISAGNAMNISRNIRNITDASNLAYHNLDKLNPDQNYILISLLPDSFKEIKESKTYFASVKIIFLNNTRIGSYRADILMLNDENETLASIPVTIKVVSSKA